MCPDLEPLPLFVLAFIPGILWGLFAFAVVFELYKNIRTFLKGG